MTPIRFDDVADVLPDLAELRPVLDHLLATSSPDPDRRWAASSELDSAGARLVDPGLPAATADALAEGESEHLARIFRVVLESIAALQRGDAASGAHALLEAAALEERRNRPHRALAYAASAARAAAGGREPRLLATALRRQARAARTAGQLPEAERLYANGHEVARDVGDTPGAAEGAIGVGNVLEEQGRWREAKEWYLLALQLVDSARPSPELWHALLNVHVATRSLGDVEESVEWLRRAEDVAGELGDPHAPAILANAWGQLHMARGDFRLARSRFEEALGAPASSWARVNFRLNLGEALLADGLTLEAAEAAREAERDALVTAVVTKLPEVYRLLGRIASARGNADAFVLFERAIQIVRDRGLPPVEEAMTLQAYARELHGAEPERAQELRRRASEIYDSLGIPGARARWAEAFGDGDQDTHVVGGAPAPETNDGEDDS